MTVPDLLSLDGRVWLFFQNDKFSSLWALTSAFILQICKINDMFFIRELSTNITEGDENRGP